MAELGNVNPIRRMACPHCGDVLPEATLQEALEFESVPCPSCGGSIRLPQDVVQRARQQRHLGHNLDITG